MRSARLFATSLVLILATAWTAQAQVVVPPPPVPATEIKNYCIYDNKLYSDGALLCVGKGKASSAPMECQLTPTAHWKVSDKTTVSCQD
jgi:hypothetical protein